MDALDRKILSTLDIDARRSDSQIGRIVRASPSTVSYRINRLVEQGIIRDFITVINQRALGWHAYRVYLKTSALSLDEEQQLVSFLTGRVVWLVRCRGAWTYNMMFFARTVDSASAFLDSFVKQHSRILIKTKFSQVSKIRHFSRRYLAPSLETSKEWVMGALSAVSALDEVDKSLLRLIQKNARESSISLADSLGVSERVVRYRLKELKSEGVVLTHRPSINSSTMGIQYYKLNLTLSSEGIALKKRVLEYFSQLPEVAYLTYALGGWDVEAEVQIPDSSDVYVLIQEVMKHFPGVIADYEVLLYDKEFDLSYMNVV